MEQYPRLSRLAKAKISLPQEPSPGCPHSCRIALQDPSPTGELSGVFIANANKLYALQIPPASEDETMVEGKEGIYLPNAIKMKPMSIDSLAFKSEVQSIDLVSDTGDLLLGGVDSYGRAIIGRLGGNLDQDSEIDIAVTCSICPSSPGEAGYAGICFNPEEVAQCVISRGYMREVVLYSDSRMERAFRFPHQPADAIIGREPCGCILVANGHEVWALDPRMAEKGGCIARMVVAHIGSQIFCVSQSHSSPGVIGAGGSDRCVTIWEPRKWVQLCKWSGCSREAITRVAFSKVAPSYGYVTGLDPACVCGVWEQGPLSKAKRKQPDENPEKPPIFRGDARWLGLKDCKSGDHLAGFTESSSLFIASFDTP